jgi:OPT oligopeptide transporter protein
MAFVTDDDSPYCEVRSAVANTDDPTMPVSTFRAWVVGLIWVIIIPGVNQFFNLRYLSVYMGAVCPSAVLCVNCQNLPLLAFSELSRARKTGCGLTFKFPCLQVVGSLPA